MSQRARNQVPKASAASQTSATGHFRRSEGGSQGSLEQLLPAPGNSSSVPSYGYQPRAGRVGVRIQSATLVADAHHSRLDALSSLGALLGLIRVAAGLPWADGVAGLVVTGFIVHVGWTVTKEIVVHLMDGVEPETLVTAERAALSVPGVYHVHARARWAGRSLLVEIEGFLAGHVSIDEAESVGQQVRHAVIGAVPQVRAVMWSPHSISQGQSI